MPLGTYTVLGAKSTANACICVCISQHAYAWAIQSARSYTTLKLLQIHVYVCVCLYMWWNFHSEFWPPTQFFATLVQWLATKTDGFKMRECCVIQYGRIQGLQSFWVDATIFSLPSREEWSEDMVTANYSRPSIVAENSSCQRTHVLEYPQTERCRRLLWGRVNGVQTKKR